MEALQFAGYFAAIFIGISLGLIGGGGSILTVPVLVYMMAVSPLIATSYSLFIVGVASLVGAFSFIKKGLVHYKTAAIFGAPAIVAVFLTRYVLLPAIPDELFSIGGLLITKNLALLLIFAVLMIAASYSMIKKSADCEEVTNGQKFNYPLILLEGVVVGVLTGLVGAGGGFLIIPALVILSRLPMKMAVGTSLLIIAVKSLIGFTGDLSHIEMQWGLLLPFTGLSILGIFIGSFLSTKIPGQKLKPAFGWFVLLMGIYIIIKELWLK